MGDTYSLVKFEGQDDRAAQIHVDEVYSLTTLLIPRPIEKTCGIESAKSYYIRHTKTRRKDMVEAANLPQRQ